MLNKKNNLEEFSPVFTSKATNILDKNFRNSINLVSHKISDFYSGEIAVFVPGSGTFAMESVARQYSNNRKCLIISNGHFGHRWKEILKQGKITNKVTSIYAIKDELGSYSMEDIENIKKKILEYKPELIFLTHVDTSTGILIPDIYIREITNISKKIGALTILDCIASGNLRVNMKNLGINIIVSAPQKGFSAHSGCGIVVLDKISLNLLEKLESSSFALDLNRWYLVMKRYLEGAFMYHGTLPTDSLLTLKDSILDLEVEGFDIHDTNQKKLGKLIREELEKKGLISVAKKGFQSPSVIVYYVEDGKKLITKFQEIGFRVAGPLSFNLGEKEVPSTFRIGLFGVEKVKNVDKIYHKLKTAFEKLL